MSDLLLPAHVAQEVETRIERLYPRRELILVRPVNARQKRSTMIETPIDDAKDRVKGGIVVRLGPKVTDPEIKEGAFVLFNSFSGVEVWEGGVEHKIMHENEVFSVVKIEELKKND